MTVSARNLDKYLGVRRYTFGMAEKNNQVGQVNGLAWTEVGGELLTIEAATMPGKGKMTRPASSAKSCRSRSRPRCRWCAPLAAARHPGGLLSEERHPHSLAGRRDAEGRSERGHRHVSRDGVRADRHTGAR